MRARSSIACPGDGVVASGGYQWTGCTHALPAYVMFLLTLTVCHLVFCSDHCLSLLQRIHELRLKLEGLDKRLVEASKAREARLRKAGAAGEHRQAPACIQERNVGLRLR